MVNFCSGTSTKVTEWRTNDLITAAEQLLQSLYYLVPLKSVNLNKILKCDYSHWLNDNTNEK